jgi:hypothetical protein
MPIADELSFFVFFAFSAVNSFKNYGVMV